MTDQFTRFLEPEISAVSYAIDLMASRMRYTTIRLLDCGDPALKVPHQFATNASPLNFMAEITRQEIDARVWHLT